MKFLLIILLGLFTCTNSWALRPIEGIILGDIKEDVPITLNGISYTDAYEGALDSRRIIQYTLDFQMNANFYGAVQEASIIRKPIVDIYSGRTEIDSDGAFDLYSPSVRIEVNPNPLNASPDSDYGFTTTIYSYEDSA